MQPLEVRDGLTGRRVAFDVPRGYGPTNLVWLTQWLDDDTVVLLSARDGGEDLLVCVIAGECEVAVSGADLVVPEMD